MFSKFSIRKFYGWKKIAKLVVEMVQRGISSHNPYKTLCVYIYTESGGKGHMMAVFVICLLFPLGPRQENLCGPRTKDGKRPLHRTDGEQQGTRFLFLLPPLLLSSLPLAVNAWKMSDESWKRGRPVSVSETGRETVGRSILSPPLLLLVVVLASS